MLNAPVTVTGNAVSVIGDSTVIGGAGSGHHGTTGGGTILSPVTSGEDGILSGNQLIPVINLPITIGGNAVSVIGDSTVINPGTPGTPGTRARLEPRARPEPPAPRNPGTPGTPGTPARPEPRHPGTPVPPEPRVTTTPWRRSAPPRPPAPHAWPRRVGQTDSPRC